MSEIVIFGNKEIAEIAHFYFTRDSNHKVASFTVDRDYIEGSSFLGAPVVPFDEINAHFPPPQYKMFIALSYSKLNLLRKQKYQAAKALGYELVTYINSKVVSWGDTVIGDNCFVLEQVVIQPFVVIGNNVTIWSGNHIGHHVKISDHCFITSQVVIAGGVDIGESCFVGINATIRDHVKIGSSCIIGAGSLITEDAAANGVYAMAAAERSKVPSQRVRSI